MNFYTRLLPWTVVLIGAFYLLFRMMPAPEKEGAMQLEQFGALPAVDGGRVKPIDTVARTTLMIMSGRQECEIGEDEKVPAIKWLLDVMTSSMKDPGKLGDRKVFTIKDAQVVSLAGLKPAEDSKYSYNDLLSMGPKEVKALFDRAGAVLDLEADRRTPFEQELLTLANQLRFVRELGPVAMHYRTFHIDEEGLLGLLGIRPRSGFRYAVEEFAGRMDALQQQADRAEAIEEKRRDPFQTKALELYGNVMRYVQLARQDAPRIVPPQDKDKDGEWQAFAQAEEEAQRVVNAVIQRFRQTAAHNNPEIAKLDNQQIMAQAGPELQKFINPATRAYTKIFAAYARGEAKAFNADVSEYEKELDKLIPEKLGLTHFEAFFNHFAPFYQCAVLYIFVFILACLSWMFFRAPLNRAAFFLAVLTFAVHTLALIGRMYIQGRPPVTNLYSSAVFIGWVCVLVSLILEVIFRNGIGNVLAAVLGALSMLIAHHLAESSGDTMEMMRAVLDTNFWLATHVTCISIGYSATFIAGFLAIMFIVMGVFTRALDRDMHRALSQMIYGIICFATLFSFVGTVLGGIWADQSWGRFWGWDSKENGALLIVIMNALTLHARWAGLVKQRGIAVLALCGNMITGWSWFGTNQLGVGLHAYGFNDQLARALTIFWCSQLAIVAVGLTPLRFWRSFQVQPRVEPSLVPKGSPKLVPQ